jgi:hypothetical protein
MSKKSRRRAPRVKSAPAKLSPASVEQKARQDLAGSRYRDAIDGFKQLLKLEPRPSWRSALADAYAGRARELAAKDMLKEALAIWENRAGLGDDIPFDPDQAALLLRMGRMSTVLGLLAHRLEMPPAEQDRLRSVLAAAYLAGEDAVAERLPEDDPVVLHGGSARVALSAYCAGDDQALQAALAAIPFRSPYRDWVQILKALQRLPDEPEEAAGLLARVAEGSAFSHLRHAAQLALLPETAFLEAIRDAGTKSVRFACVLRGWPQARIALWEELRRLGPEPRPETVLRLMVRHRNALGGDWVRRRGLRLLVAGYPASRKWLRAANAPGLSSEESLLLAAWSAEHHDDLWEGQERWGAYARHLMRTPSDNSQESERNLRIALALRRCERLGNVVAHGTPSADPDDIDHLVAGQMEESLTWDPEDRDAYLRLIGYYQRGKRPKDVRRLLSKARERWPKDMQVLEADLNSALESGAFKKAAGLARQMLALDSINSTVRERLVQAHLAHARKQVLKGRPDLARKELAQAEEWARSADARDRIHLTAGLITLIEDAERGAPILLGLLERAGGGLAAYLTLSLAAEPLDISPQKLFRKIGVEMPAVAGREELLATLGVLRRHLDGGGRMTVELVSNLSKLLAESPWRDLSRSETEAACDTLRRCRLHETRLRAARAALKRWKGEPIFELHAFEARYPRNPGDCSDRDIERLTDALARARKDGDPRIAMRIEEILADLDPFPFGPVPFAPPPPSGSGDRLLDGGSITTLIETLGLDKTLNALGLPPEMKRDIKKLAREQGEEAVAHALGSFLEMIAGIAEGEIDLPFGGPPTRKPTEPKGGRPQGRSGTDKGQDDDPFEQLDLFP